MKPPLPSRNTTHPNSTVLIRKYNQHHNWQSCTLRVGTDEYLSGGLFPYVLMVLLSKTGQQKHPKITQDIKTQRPNVFSPMDGDHQLATNQA